MKTLEKEEQDRTKVISVMNNKGGCGKTTTAMGLGMYLVRTGNNVLFWDNDPQSNLTQRLGLDDREKEHGRLHMLFKNPETGEDYSFIARYPHLQRVHGSPNPPGKVGIMPGSHTSEIAARGLAESLKLGYPNIGHRDIHRFFKDRVDYFRQYYNYIIIDTAPALEGNVLNCLAVTSADEIIYPVDGLEAASGVRTILNWMESETQARTLRPNGLFVMVKYQMDTKNIGMEVPDLRMRNAVYRALKESFGDFVCDKGVRELRSLRYSIAGFGGKTDYTDLSEEVVDMISKPRKNLFDYLTVNSPLDELENKLAIIEKKVRKRRPKFKRPKYVPAPALQQNLD